MVYFANWPIFSIGVSAAANLNALSIRTALPPLVPAVHSFEPRSQSDFNLPNTLHILIDQDFAGATTDSGLTTIPPTLQSFTNTFASDLKGLFPRTATSVTSLSAADLSSHKDYVFFTLSPSTNITLANGDPTTEGYEMTTSPDGIAIAATGPRGAFWATRTLLQGLVQTKGRFPSSIIRDGPDWPTRGIMLDVGRHWYPIDFLKEICAYASWFKMSEFHVHLSDNINPRGHPDAYARFRLRSNNPEFAGLTPFVNETYSRADFDGFQQFCADRGVTVVPEIESPGHALVITQWKPELALSDNPTLLNLSVPETTATVKAIWKEFLPWFRSKQVSIGADEYDSDLADDYNTFVNTMSDFIQAESNKTIRIWSTFEPSNTTSVSKKIIKQHWSFGDGDPFQLIQQGYHVINSEDSVHYIVMKQPQPDSFPQRLNQTRLWDGANVDTGGIWDPHVFDRGNASNNPSIAEPLLQGSIMAVWNDHGPNASTVLEAFYSMKQGLPVIAAANWQAASRANHLTHAQFLQAFPALEASAPGQNLDRRIPSKSSLVAEYVVRKAAGGRRVEDQSGNGYHARLSNGVLHTPLGSKGHNYTLLVSVSLRGATGTLLAGPDSAFGFAAIDGAPTLAFVSSNITYPLFNYTLPLKGSSHDIVIVGTETSTTAWVDGKRAGEFVVGIDGTAQFQPMAFVAPVQQIGQVGSRVERFALWDGVRDVALLDVRVV